LVNRRDGRFAADLQSGLTARLASSPNDPSDKLRFVRFTGSKSCGHSSTAGDARRR
jgi:hypothetical protein